MVDVGRCLGLGMLGMQESQLKGIPGHSPMGIPMPICPHAQLMGIPCCLYAVMFSNVVCLDLGFRNG